MRVWKYYATMLQEYFHEKLPWKTIKIKTILMKTIKKTTMLKGRVLSAVALTCKNSYLNLKVFWCVQGL